MGCVHLDGQMSGQWYEGRPADVSYAETIDGLALKFGQQLKSPPCKGAFARAPQLQPATASSGAQNATPEPLAALDTPPSITRLEFVSQRVGAWANFAPLLEAWTSTARVFHSRRVLWNLVNPLPAPRGRPVDKTSGKYIYGIVKLS